MAVVVAVAWAPDGPDKKSAQVPFANWLLVAEGFPAEAESFIYAEGKKRCDHFFRLMLSH